MARLLALVRYIVIVPVIASLLGAVVLMVYGAVQTVTNTLEAAQLMFSGSQKGLKQEAVVFIELVDVFLLATVLLIIGIGLYELFIGKLDLPEWLVITSLDDLKVKLISVVVTVLAVLFLGQAVSSGGTPELLLYAAAISLVIIALTAFLVNAKR